MNKSRSHRRCSGRERALDEARALRKRISGGPWKIRVWYNHGEWNYSLQLGSLNLDPGCGRYFCLMSDTHGDSAGLPDWTEHAPGGRGARLYCDPNKAVAKQIKAARRYVNKLDKVVRFVEERFLMHFRGKH